MNIFYVQRIVFGKFLYFKGKKFKGNFFIYKNSSQKFYANKNFKLHNFIYFVKLFYAIRNFWKKYRIIQKKIIFICIYKNYIRKNVTFSENIFKIFTKNCVWKDFLPLEMKFNLTLLLCLLKKIEASQFYIYFLKHFFKQIEILRKTSIVLYYNFFLENLYLKKYYIFRKQNS